MLAGILIYFIIDYFRKHPDVFRSLQHLELRHIWLVILFDIIVIALFAMRTFMVLKKFANWTMPYWSWLRIHVIGQLLNFFLSQAGDLYRANAAKRHSALPYSNYAAVFLMISWLDMVVTVLLATGFRVSVPMELSAHDLPVTTLLIFVAICIAIPPVGTLLFRLMIAIPFCPKVIRQGIRNLLTEFWRATYDLKMNLYLIVIALIAFSAMTLMVLVIFQGLGSNIALYQAALLIVVYRLSQAFVLTPGNIGVREWTIGGVCLALGIDPGHGLLFSLIMRAVHLAALGIAGGGLFMHQRFKWSL